MLCKANVYFFTSSPFGPAAILRGKIDFACEIYKVVGKEIWKLGELDFLRKLALEEKT